MKHTILFLAANPAGTDLRGLAEEARSIQDALERGGYRDQFQLETRWAAQPLDLLREMRRLKPTVVHFSGHGHSGHGGQSLVFFESPDGRAQLVSSAALASAFGAASPSVRIVVLSSCYSAAQAAALVGHVDCVVGLGDSIGGGVARSFAVGFYGGLGDGVSVEAAFRQGCAAIALEGLHDSGRPQMMVRSGVDASRLVIGDSSPS